MRKLLVLLAAVAFVFAFTTPAKADVSFSGYVAMMTYMLDVDNPAPTKDSSDLDWDKDNTCSRLTVNFKEGPVGGLVEIRPNVASYVRHWWGTWNFGGGTLGVGQYWTPEFSSISSMSYGCGAMDVIDCGGSVRQPMIQVQFGGLKIAAANPSTGVATGLPAGYTDTETSMPKIMASYDLNMGGVGLKFYGGFNSVDARDPTTDQSQSIDSHLLGVNATFGAGPLTIKGQVWTAENSVEYGAGTTGHFAATWDGTKICDESFMSYGFDLAYKASDTVTVTAGYFLSESESDQTGTWEDETSTMHVNATFTLAKGVTITPEYAVLDRKDCSDSATTKVKEAKDTRIGVYWKIAF